MSTRRDPRTSNRGECGQVTASFAILVAALLLSVGLVHDGALVLAAHRRAINTAEAAAHAGAQALDEAAYRTTGTIRLDPRRATSLAHGYLAATGHPHTVQVTLDEVEVTVTITQPLRLLSLVGLRSRTVTGHASARAVPDLQDAAS